MKTTEESTFVSHFGSWRSGCIVAVVLVLSGGVQTVFAQAGLVGACCTATGCFEGPSTQCTGTFLGDGTACGPIVGCCGPGGDCADMAEGCCLNRGGSILPSLCMSGPVGCCLPDGTCRDMDQQCCAAAGGSASASFCTVREACCVTTLAGTTCRNLDPVCCADLNGVSQGPGTQCLGDGNGDNIDDACMGPGCRPTADQSACEPTPCADQTQNCLPSCINVTPNLDVKVLECACQSDAQCHPAVDSVGGSVSCVGNCPAGMVCREDSTIQPDGSLNICCSCVPDQPLGVCCLPDGFCTQLPPDVCRAQGGVAGPPMPCSQPVSCCLPEGGCRLMEPFCCQALGGFVGGTDVCDPLVSCCLPDGTCVLTQPTCCDLLFQGSAIDPAAQQCTGTLSKCCLPDGSCDILDAACCAAQGGTALPNAGADCLVVTGCCLPDGTCQDMDKDCCTARGGVPTNTMCEGTVTGCCLLDGSCADLDPVCCLSQEGFPKASPCGTHEACCLDPTSPLGTFGCLDTDPVCCSRVGGQSRGDPSRCIGDNNGNDVDDTCERCVPLPDGSGCLSPPCPALGNECLPKCALFDPVTGASKVVDCACQSPNGCFIDVSVAGEPACTGACPAGTVCVRQSNVNADGTITVCCDCAPVTTGACCLQNGCAELTPADCELQGGSFAGPGTTCGPVDACCFGDNGCAMLNEACCVLRGGTPLAGRVCSNLREACCGPGGACSFGDPVCCDARGGVSLGPNSQCGTQVKCCSADGGCNIEDSECCRARGGVPVPITTAGCTTPIQCCLPDGTCLDMDRECCNALGGVVPNTPCGGQRLGCCIPGEACVDLDPACCIARGGTVQALPCSGDLVGCCLDDGRCVDMERECCVAQGGTPFNDLCMAPQACCIETPSPAGPIVRCLDTDPRCCAMRGGVRQGPGTQCLGDGDGDGRDDSCRLCAPTVDRKDCIPTDCGPNDVTCRPGCVDILPDGQVLVTSCECRNVDECWVIVPPNGGAPFCGGACLTPGLQCTPSRQVAADGTITLCCDCAPPPTGACCLPDGTCRDLTRDECLLAQGTYGGDHTACDGTIAECCFNDGTCRDLDPFCCELRGGSPNRGEQCGPREACCRLSGNCVNEDPSCCSSAGGLPLGPNSFCDEPVKCCLPDGTCDFLDKRCCAALGGVIGNRQGCDEVDCCLPGGGCRPIDRECCERLGGKVNPGVCLNGGPDVGCCLPNGKCINTKRECCLAFGGIPSPNLCGPREACCLPFGVVGGRCACIETDPNCCELVGGAPQGPGSACSTTLCDRGPFIVHAKGKPGQTQPCTGYIDPRVESTTGGTPDLGVDSLIIEFSEPVFSPGGGPVGPADFMVTETGGGVPPAVVAVVTADNILVRIELDRIITLQEWTTIQAKVVDDCGNRIISFGNLGPGMKEPDRIDVARLPADVSQDGKVEPVDLIRFRQNLSGIFHNECIDLWYFDIDRDGMFPLPADLIRMRQLLAGTPPATKTWLLESLHSPQP